MGRTSKDVPISVAMDKEQREVFADEARRRGLGVSTTIRALALERAIQIRDERQLARARHWQTQRMRTMVDRMDGGDNPVIDQVDIDRIFDDAEVAGRGKRKS